VCDLRVTAKVWRRSRGRFVVAKTGGRIARETLSLVVALSAIANQVGALCRLRHVRHVFTPRLRPPLGRQEKSMGTSTANLWAVDRCKRRNPRELRPLGFTRQSVPSRSSNRQSNLPIAFGWTYPETRRIDRLSRRIAATPVDAIGQRRCNRRRGSAGTVEPRRRSRVFRGGAIFRGWSDGRGALHDQHGPLLPVVEIGSAANAGESTNAAIEPGVLTRSQAASSDCGRDCACGMAERFSDRWRRAAARPHLGKTPSLADDDARRDVGCEVDGLLAVGRRSRLLFEKPTRQTTANQRNNSSKHPRPRIAIAEYLHESLGTDPCRSFDAARPPPPIACWGSRAREWKRSEHFSSGPAQATTSRNSDGVHEVLGSWRCKSGAATRLSCS